MIRRVKRFCLPRPGLMNLSSQAHHHQNLINKLKRWRGLIKCEISPHVKGELRHHVVLSYILILRTCLLPPPCRHQPKSKRDTIWNLDVTQRYSQRRSELPQMSAIAQEGSPAKLSRPSPYQKSQALGRIRPRSTRNGTIQIYILRYKDDVPANVL